MPPDEQFPHDDLKAEAEAANDNPQDQTEGETPEQFESRLFNAARDTVSFLTGKVKNAAELKTTQIMALANTISMSENPTEDTLNGIELLLNLIRHYKGVRAQLQLVTQFEAALATGPTQIDESPLTNPNG